MIKIKFYFLIFWGIACFYSNMQATNFTVTNTNNSGSGSLREALQMAAYLSGPHTINFNIPQTDPNYNSALGVWKITPSTTFDYIIKNNVTIDGTTQTTNQGDTNPLGPEIYLDGNNNSINFCFSIINASGILIKGLIISDFMYGIQLYGSSCINNTITGNYIGTNADATDTAGNYIGIEIISGADNNTIGGASDAERNVISGNEHIGIRLLDVSNCLVTGNYVGIDRTGTLALPNYDGISIEGASKYNVIGGIDSGLRNIVSGNVAYGIPIFGSGAEGNTIIGNYIGTDITGSIAIPNTYGVLFDDGSFDNLVGGTSEAEKNIISGNSGYGVFIYNMGTHANIVKGNFIGTDVSGTIALPNAIGIVVDGAAFDHIIDSNIISGNLQQGIYINITGSDGTQIIKNKIGVDANNNPLGNGSDGIRISQGPKNSIIGGSESDANIIAYNKSGVYIMFPEDDNHLISYNSIYNNTEMGIDLYPYGANENDNGDLDNGPNEEMNYPKIDTIIFISDQSPIIVSGTFDTQNPELCTIQLYKAIPDQSGHGQGQEYLSTIIPDAFGNWSDTLNGLTESDYLTSLAIDAENNTSEFSVARNSTSVASANTISKNDVDIIYYNEAVKKIYINLKNADNAILEIYNLTGEIMYQTKIINQLTEIECNLTNGLFLYSLSDQKNIFGKGKLIYNE